MDELVLGQKYKRFLASLLDYILVFGLAICLFMLLVNGTINIGFNNLEYKLNQFKLEEESHLFDVTYSTNGEIEGVSLLTFDVNNKEEYKIFNEAIKNYFFEYLNNEDASNQELNISYFLFDTETLENSIFKIESIDASIDEFVLKDEITNVSDGSKVSKDDENEYFNAIKEFYMNENKGIYNLALTDFTNEERFNSLVTTLTQIERIEALICVAFSALIIVALPTILNKNSESLFMHIFKLGFSNRDGYKVKLTNRIIRAITLVILLGISTYLYLIPLIINALIILLNKKDERSLVDIISNEVCLDLRYSYIYDSYEEYMKNSENKTTSNK